MDGTPTFAGAFLVWLDAALLALVPVAVFAKTRRRLSRWLLGAATCLVLVKPFAEALLSIIWGEMAPRAFAMPPGNFRAAVFLVSVLQKCVFMLPWALTLAAVLLGRAVGEEKPSMSVGMGPSSIAGRTRPVWKVLLLSATTLSVFFWVYLYKSIRELGFATEVKSRRKLVGNSKAWWLLLLTVSALSAATAAALLLVVDSATVQKTVASRLVIVADAVLLGFWLAHTRLLRAARRGLNMPAGSTAVLRLSLTLSLAAAVVFSLAVLKWPPVAIASAITAGVAGAVFVCLILSETNAIWQKKAGHSPVVGAGPHPPAATPPGNLPVG